MAQFALELMQKDLSYAIAETETHSVLLNSAAARKMFAAASAQGFGKLDFSAIVESLRKTG